MESQENPDKQSSLSENDASFKRNDFYISDFKMWMLAIGAILSFAVFGGGGYYLGFQQGFNDSFNSITMNSQSPTPTARSQVNTTSQKPGTPKLAVFMREGEIWVKDYQANQERKVSSSPKVGYPAISPTGNYLTYFEIAYAAGGFPLYSLYVTDVEGKYEKTFSLKANRAASKLKWSHDGGLLGVVLFNDESTEVEYEVEAFIYDPIIKQEVLIGNTTSQMAGFNFVYTIDSNCEQLQPKYVAFCNEYVSYISKESETTQPYKWDEFRESKYAKEGYKLTRSEKLDNGLVILEYYTGNPQNPEASWGIAGGVFVPGFDEGVKDTYTILLKEEAEKVIDETSPSVDTDFYF